MQASALSPAPLPKSDLMSNDLTMREAELGLHLAWTRQPKEKNQPRNQRLERRYSQIQNQSDDFVLSSLKSKLSRCSQQFQDDRGTRTIHCYFFWSCNMSTSTVLAATDKSRSSLHSLPSSIQAPFNILRGLETLLLATSRW